LFFGKYDAIIPPSYGKHFANALAQPYVMVILDSGHRVMEKYKEICEIILKQEINN
jgi:hypothetical protein